jgi:hypothetical protein
MAIIGEEEHKSSSILNSQLNNIKHQREAVSDDEEEKHPKEIQGRKAELLDIDNSDDEFQMKTGCCRKKSADFNREKTSLLNKQGINRIDLIRAEEMI